MNEILRDSWIAEIKKLNPKIFKSDIKSPTFEYGNWRIAPEHQRNFKSVVIRWIGSKSNAPVLPDKWLSNPNDVRKGWTYRAKLFPSELPTLLQKLVQFENGQIMEAGEALKEKEDTISSEQARLNEHPLKTQSLFRESNEISEKGMEDAIVNNPKKFIGEDGLRLIARQYRIGNYIFDLVFEDRHGAKLIVEIQKGTLDRGHTYKILDYYDEYKVKYPKEFIELLIIANKIPQERRDRLISMGIEFREISMKQFLIN